MRGIITAATSAQDQQLDPLGIVVLPLFVEPQFDAFASELGSVFATIQMRLGTIPDDVVNVIRDHGAIA